jgi:hypothetical protein
MINRTTATLLLALAAGACRSGSQVPEPGAVLLKLQMDGQASAPDELRLWVYDDSGTLWSDVRFPSEGTLAPPRGGDLGTILIQPGAVSGKLRIHARALAGGARVLDGTLAFAPGAGASTPTLELAVDLPQDSDGDGVPDDIDDCASTANPDQGGCALPSDAGSGEETDGGATDAANDAAPDVCDGAPVCNQPVGSSCGLDAECASGFCADGVCCASACIGPCRSCNQPGSDGVCQPYALGSDPERECSDTTCNGAGACGAPPPPTNKTNGSVCQAGGECASGFCTDGVCCPEACTAACLSCATGTCTMVKNRDDAPACAAPMTCNTKGKCIGGG